MVEMGPPPTINCLQKKPSMMFVLVTNHTEKMNLWLFFFVQPHDCTEALCSLTSDQYMEPSGLYLM